MRKESLAAELERKRLEKSREGVGTPVGDKMEGSEDRGGKEGGAGEGEGAGDKRESVGEKGAEGGKEEPERKKFKVRLGQRDDLKGQ